MRKNSRILTDLFWNVIISMILVELANVGCGFVDGVIISRFLGDTAMAALGVAYPYFSVLGIISGMLATGMQTLCTTYIGEGKRKELNSVFSLTCIVTALASAVATLVLLLFSRQVSAALGGANSGPELLRDVQKYLRGVAIGTPALMFVAILAPIVHLDGSKMRVRISVIGLFIADILGDLLAVALKGGIFGMGLATSLSNYLAAAILLTHFLGKNCSVRFTLSDLNVPELWDILKIGLPKATKRLANSLRPLCLNRMVLHYGAAAAMSAMSIRNNLNNLMDIFGSGLVAAVLLMIGILYGEKNRTAIRQITRQALRYNLLIVGSLAMVIIALAPQIALFYTDDPQVTREAVVAIRCMALNLPLNTLVEIFVNYLQGTNRHNGVHILNFCSRFVCVVVCAFVMGHFWGINGIWAAFPAGSMLLIAAIAVVCRIKGEAGLSLYETMFSLPEAFGVRDDNTLEISVATQHEVIDFSIQTIAFCKAHNIDERRAFLMGLCIEEMAGNIVTHGFPMDHRKHSLDIRVIVSEDRLTLRLRDDCPLFDVKEKGEQWRSNPEDPAACIGIRMVYRISEELIYINTLGTNNLIVTI